LRRKTPLRRRKPLPRVSKKRRSSGYFDQRWEFLLLHPVCQICSKRRSRDVHHMAGREGPLLCAEQFWMAVCRRCHDEIHDSPAWARSRGYLISPGLALAQM
jgi:hypothetical protein